jgi:hypothetical protein
VAKVERLKLTYQDKIDLRRALTVLRDLRDGKGSNADTLRYIGMLCISLSNRMDLDQPPFDPAEESVASTKAIASAIACWSWDTYRGH